MPLFKKAQDEGYSFATANEIEGRIRSDLSRVGNVSEVKGNIMIVDGDWYLSDVVAVLDGKDVECHRTDSGILYRRNNNDINISFYPSAYARGGEETLTETLSSIHKASKDEQDEFMEGTGEIFLLLLMVFPLLFFVIYMVATAVSMVIFYAAISLAGSVALLVGGHYLHRHVQIEKDAKLHNKIPYDEAIENRKEDLIRHAIRISKARGWSYTGGVEVDPCYGKPSSPSSMILRFKFRDSSGQSCYCRTDGITVSGWIEH